MESNWVSWKIRRETHLFAFFYRRDTNEDLYPTTIRNVSDEGAARPPIYNFVKLKGDWIRKRPLESKEKWIWSIIFFVNSIFEMYIENYCIFDDQWFLECRVFQVGVRNVFFTAVYACAHVAGDQAGGRRKWEKNRRYYSGIV